MRAVVLLFITLLSISPLFGQKLKYKDIFPRISAGDASAHVDLKAFISEPKNVDHPNANYQLAAYLESQVYEADILKDTSAIYNKVDSAVRYFQAAKTYITEKELKKNDEYYQEFYRRDLRTGEFGIKLSDVQLTIEKRIEGLKDLRQYVKEVNQHLKVSNQFYNQAYLLFDTLTSGFDDQRKFLITAKEQQLGILHQIAMKMDSFETAFESMRISLSKIENPRFGPELNFMEIEAFDADFSGADFYENQFQLYDYRSWADDAGEKIKYDIIPLRSKIIEYDTRIDGIRENLVGASTEDRQLVLDEELVNTLQQYDEEPIIAEILEVKVAQIGILSSTDTTLNPILLDSTFVDSLVQLHDTLVHDLRMYGEKVHHLKGRDVEEDLEIYQDYFEQRFGGPNSYLVWVKEQEEAYNSMLYNWVNSKYYWLEKSKWGMLEQDTIPLFIRPDSLFEDPTSRFKSLQIARDDSLNLYPIGIDFQEESPQGFVAGFANSRDLKWFQTLDLGSVPAGDSLITIQAQIAPSDSSKLTFYFYSPEPELEKNFAIYNLDYSGELIWANFLKFEQAPESVKFNEEVLETIIYLPMNELGEGLNYVVIDRNGKVRGDW